MIEINFTNYEHFMVDFLTQEFINHFTCIDLSKFMLKAGKVKRWKHFNLELLVLCHNETKKHNTIRNGKERNRFWETQVWALLFLVFHVMLHPLHHKYMLEKSFILPRDKNEFCQFHTNLEFESLGNLHIQIFLYLSEAWEI